LFVVVVVLFVSAVILNVILKVCTVIGLAVLWTASGVARQKPSTCNSMSNRYLKISRCIFITQRTRQITNHWMDQSPLMIHVERPCFGCFPTLWAWSLACIYHTCKLSLVIYHETNRVCSFDFQNNNKHFSSCDFDLLLVEVCFFACVIFCNLNWSSVFWTKCRHLEILTNHGG